ncbi:MAG TPA: NmrA/HSCARG family protein, partial [Bryobacteraceae bacterium]
GGHKIIAVVGATGAQGGGLVRAIQAYAGGGFRARALTRNVRSTAAQELASLGAEVVAADIDDPESLRRAFKGADAAYCVTFYWAHFSPEKELAQAASLARAAKSAGVGHVIWSTLEDTRRWVPLTDHRMPTLMGKYKVPHLDAKGEADRFFTEAGVPTTFLLTSFFWDNFIHFGMGPQRGPEGTLAITFPMADKKLPGIAAEDIGRCAFEILKRGREFIGRTVGVAGEHLTGLQMAAAFTTALGRTVRYNDVSPEVYRGLGFPGADDLGNMFQFKRDFNEAFCGARDVAATRALNPRLQTFAAWLAANRTRIPVAAGGASA